VCLEQFCRHRCVPLRLWSAVLRALASYLRTQRVSLGGLHGLGHIQMRSVRALLLSFLAFGSHLLADAEFSGWDLYLFWPFSTRGYSFPGAVGLEAPINTHLVYYSFVVVGLLALIYKRTPLDIFSPRLDQLHVFCRGRTSCPSEKTIATGRAVVRKYRVESVCR